MPIIFKNIRRKLAAQNRATAYVRYAIGEILLVVIGILIALQVNNWNTKRLNYQKSIQYHERIIQDLDRFIQRTDHVKTVSIRTIRVMSIALGCLEKGKLPKDKIQDFNNAIARFYRFDNLNPDFSTLEEMKSTGDLGLIYNIKLRNEIVDLENESEDYNNILLSLGKTTYARFPIFDKYIRSHVDTTTYQMTFTSDFKKMAADKDFINNFSRIETHWRGSAFFCFSLNKEARKVRQDFQNELNKMKK